MYPAVPPRHTSTPPWPQQGSGQRRACSQDPSDNAHKAPLSLLHVIGGCHKVRQRAETLRRQGTDVGASNRGIRPRLLLKANLFILYPKQSR